MNKIFLLIMGSALSAVVPVVANSASAGGLGEAAELEHARANARAGGPISDRDAELLDRWGCLSGTQNPYCDRWSHEHRQARHLRRHNDRN